MAERREKTVGYRRAVWLTGDPQSVTLEGLVKQAGGKLKTAEERTIIRGNQEMVLAHLRSKDGGQYLHIAVDTPGEHASVLPRARKATSEIDVGTTAPPTGAEFMDGDAFVFIQENHVCLCTTGIQDGGVRNFLHSLFRKATLRHDADKFELMKVADMSALKLLQSQGAKEIQLSALISEATIHYAKRKHHVAGIVGSIAKQLRAVLGNEHDVTEDAMQVALTLTTDRRRKGLVLGEKRLQTLALDVVENAEEGDDYVIVTKSGQKIGPHEIFVRSKVKIDAVGKSVDRDKAWKELRAFYTTLNNAGILEQ